MDHGCYSCCLAPDEASNRLAGQTRPATILGMRDVVVVAIGCTLWACERDPVTPPPGSVLTPVTPVLELAAPPPAAMPMPPPPAARAADLFGHDRPLGREITVDLVEPLLDAKQTSGAAPGEYEVIVYDIAPERLVLGPGTLTPLPSPLRSPVRVRGTLEVANHGLRIRVAELTQQRFPAPVRLPSAAALMKDRARWSGRYVQIEDTWTVGFEISMLGSVPGGLWLDAHHGANLVCQPPPKPRSGFAEPDTHKVRVTGIAYIAGRDGHLDQGPEIVATDLVYLDPSRPECK
jgi:hypothetical protein